MRNTVLNILVSVRLSTTQPMWSNTQPWLISGSSWIGPMTLNGKLLIFNNLHLVDIRYTKCYTSRVMETKKTYRVCGIVVRNWHMLLIVTSPFWLLIPLAVSSK